MYAVMSYSDDCNIISYRIDRYSEWSVVEKSRHLHNRIVYTAQCVTRRIRVQKIQTLFSIPCHTVISSLQYNGLIDEYFFTRFWACRRTWNDSEHGRQSGPAKWERGGEKNISRDITLYWLGGGFVSNESDDDAVVQI